MGKESLRRKREQPKRDCSPAFKSYLAYKPACLSLWERCHAATEKAGFLLRTNQTCLSLWERCRAATERACISYILSPVCLIRICSRAALSVICFANASSPRGRAKKPVRTARLTNQVNSHTNLFACCSFRHGLRRATFLREEGLSQFYSCSHCCIHRALTASDGMRQSPRGDSVTVPTFGPSGRQERLNCWIKNRRTNVVSHFLMVSSS